MLNTSENSGKDNITLQQLTPNKVELWKLKSYNEQEMVIFFNIWQIIMIPSQTICQEKEMERKDQRETIKEDAVW